MYDGLSLAVADLHSPVKVILDEPLDALAGDGEEGSELFQLGGGEGGQHPVLHVIVGVGLLAHAEADAGELIRAQLVDDAPQSPLASVGAFSAHPHAAYVQAHVVRANDDMVGGDLVELGGGGHSLSRGVHVGLGTHDQHSRAGDGGLAYQSVELRAVGGTAVLLAKGVQKEEARVVTGQGVLLAWVAQTHQNVGNGGGGGSGLVLFKTLEDVENVGHGESFSVWVWEHGSQQLE